MTKAYFKWWEHYLEQRSNEERFQKYLEQFTSLYQFEHIDFGKYRVPNSECNAKVGEHINARFVSAGMKSGNDYYTGIFRVYAKDNEYTYITRIRN